jgi:hypothetical protein
LKDGGSSQREICRVVAGIGVVLRGLTIADLLNSMDARGRQMDELAGREAQPMCERRDALQAFDGFAVRVC